MIKKFEEYTNESNLDSYKKPESIADRLKVNEDIFKECMSKIKEIMVNNFTGDVNWSTIGSLSHINSDLIDIIEGWDEDYANMLREKLKPRR